MVFSIISVTTDAILEAARNHPEKIGSHGQSRWILLKLIRNNVLHMAYSYPTAQNRDNTETWLSQKM